jgi:hypothetical protein
MSYRFAAATVLLLAACSQPRRPTPPAEGTLSGLVRTADTGAPVTDVRIVVRRAGDAADAPAIEQRSGSDGAYVVPRLAPGEYDVKVYRDDRPIGDQRIAIEAGRITGLDLAAPAEADPADPADTADTNAAADGDHTSAPADAVVAVDTTRNAPLWRYRPLDGDATVATIEGTVSEEGERTRLGGAVITVTDRAGGLIADAITDDDGRFRIERLAPGGYVVSAYYTLIGRGQFEIRRNDVDVAAGEVVVVPLAIETDGN